jgi:hypothetical protein
MWFFGCGSRKNGSTGCSSSRYPSNGKSRLTRWFRRDTNMSLVSLSQRIHNPAILPHRNDIHNILLRSRIHLRGPTSALRRPASSSSKPILQLCERSAALRSRIFGQVSRRQRFSRNDQVPSICCFWISHHERFRQLRSSSHFWKGRCPGIRSKGPERWDLTARGSTSWGPRDSEHTVVLCIPSQPASG